MAAVDDLDQAVEKLHLALGEFMKGSPEPAKKLFSHRENVTLANPFGGVAHGWEQVAQTMERAAAHYSEGTAASFETVAKCVTPDLAYLVQVERLKAKVDGGEEFVPFALRVTMIFRPKDGEWKVAHRHADPITTAQPAESVVQQ